MGPTSAHRPISLSLFLLFVRHPLLPFLFFLFFTFYFTLHIRSLFFPLVASHPRDSPRCSRDIRSPHFFFSLYSCPFFHPLFSSLSSTRTICNVSLLARYVGHEKYAYVTKKRRSLVESRKGEGERERERIYFYA